MKTFLPVVAMLLLADFAYAQTWFQGGFTTNNYWSCVAASADGTKMVAAILDGYHGLDYVYTSTNSGAAWELTGAPTNFVWNCAATSADGSKMMLTAFNSAHNGGGAIFISTNFGNDWLPASAPTNCNWSSIASSADGNKLAAVSNLGIYNSTNGGMAWTLQTNPPATSLYSVVSSADGARLVVAAINGSGLILFRSTNSGMTWVPATTPPKPGGVNMNSGQQVIASSADGTRLVAAFNGDSLLEGVPFYISTNSGATWAALAGSPNNNWTGIASSADGTRLVAVAVPASSPQDAGPVYTSTNSGITWVSNAVPNQEWTFCASSADGGIFVAVSGKFVAGSIYALQNTPAPSLNLATSTTNLTLAWTVPSTNFLLQQSADLMAWANVTNPPNLNLTNLQNQVTLPATNAAGFFRLRTP